MSRGGASKDRDDGPDRKCIATGEVQPKYGLVRFVVGPDDQVYPDILGKLPGRGMYVAADRAAIELAISKKLFTRAAKQQVKVQDDLLAEVEKQLARRVVDLAADRLDQIAWEVVPDMAEIVVRQRIRELEAESEASASESVQ